MAIKKLDRILTWHKYGNKCAYCGKDITYKELQVDHIIPKRRFGYGVRKNLPDYSVDDIRNLNPSCRRCNHYKRAYSVEQYRALLMSLHERLENTYLNKVGLDYKILQVTKWSGRFYFEDIKT